MASASSSSPAISLMLACRTGGASTEKITWISLPSSSVTSARTDIGAQLVSASAASSKSDGRTPRITSRPK